MAYNSWDGNRNFYLDIKRNLVPGYKVIHKFGRNASVGTSYVPISVISGYWTPTVAASLEVISDSADDTAAGTGARSVRLIGLDENWDEVEEVVSTNGLSASTATTNTFIRFYRGYVEDSGTYATSAAGSHAGNVTIRVEGAGATVGKIETNGFPKSQTQIGILTIPRNYNGYITEIDVTVDGSKSSDMLLFQRQGADVITPPYKPMRLVREHNGISDPFAINHLGPLGPFPEKTDLGFMGKVSTGTGVISVDFEIVLVDESVGFKG